MRLVVCTVVFSGDHGFGDGSVKRMYGVCVVFPKLHHYEPPTTTNSATCDCGNAAAATVSGNGWMDGQQRAPAHSGGESLILTVEIVLGQKVWLSFECRHA